VTTRWGRLIAAEKEAACQLCKRHGLESTVTTEMLMDRVRELRSEREASASRSDLLMAADGKIAEAERLRALANKRPGP
jgi:hypothetical protein